ncbi:MAG: response regulator transcription factor [Anaerolineae bacterium]|nr:response regulator transcription factor [Anaerolineae bacterium]
MPPFILVVDDEDNVRRLVTVNLQARGFNVQEARDGLQAITVMQHNWPELVILDLNMPGMSGKEVCTWIREQDDSVPIVVLTAAHDEALMIEALNLGADDYITKPFNHDVLVARVRAVMRRSAAPEQTPNPESIKIEGLLIDLKGRRVYVDDKDIHLTRTEFALLATLAQNQDRILEHDDLLAKVWGGQYRGSNHYLHVYFGRIRKKLENYQHLLETVAGQGYILRSSARH